MWPVHEYECNLNNTSLSSTKNHSSVKMTTKKKVPDVVFASIWATNLSVNMSPVKLNEFQGTWWGGSI